MEGLTIVTYFCLLGPTVSPVFCIPLMIGAGPDNMPPQSFCVLSGRSASRCLCRGALAREGTKACVNSHLSVQTERVPLDLSPRLEETLDFGEVELEPIEVEDFEARGSRFSKSADERQRMLVQRKDDLLQQARK